MHNAFIDTPTGEELYLYDGQNYCGDYFRMANFCMSTSPGLKIDMTDNYACHSTKNTLKIIGNRTSSVKFNNNDQYRLYTLHNCTGDSITVAASYPILP